MPLKVSRNDTPLLLGEANRGREKERPAPFSAYSPSERFLRRVEKFPSVRAATGEEAVARQRR